MQFGFDIKLTANRISEPEVARMSSMSTRFFENTLHFHLPDCIHTYSGLDHMYRRLWHEMTTTPFLKLSVYVFIFNKISLLSHLLFLICSCPYSYNYVVYTSSCQFVQNQKSTGRSHQKPRKSRLKNR
jgi:hypothetical protein